MSNFDFNRSFGFVLHETARLLSKRYDQRAKSLGLTRAQIQVLAYLVYHEGINQAGLAELIEIEPISLARLIDRMEQSGWVERRPDPRDRRAWQLYITNKAKPVFAEMIAVGAEVRGEALAGFSELERDQVMELLLRVRRNLSERGGEGAAPLAGAAE
ncbi:MAG: MarR family winged helix-turn-helix transcriptional regulator [Stellaceae bacterium]